MASSAIPFLFPATALWVDGRREFFGDGSMRQVSPLSPAMHLGAHKRLGGGGGSAAALGPSAAAGDRARAPAWAIAGHAMASVFHDTLQADVEQAQRVTRTLQQMPREVAAVLPYRSVEVLAIQPSQSLDSAGQGACQSDLPQLHSKRAERLGALRGGGAWPATCCLNPALSRPW
jgi:NTE family protein